MTESLALFPLQLVVFPGEALNLHVFEPRYRQLVEDAEREGVRFGVPTVIDGNLRPVATEVTLTGVAERYPSGESDIRTTGGRVFTIRDFDRTMPGKLYPGGTVSYLDVDEDEDPKLNERIVKLTRSIYEGLGIERRIPSVGAGFRTYDIGHYVGLTLEQEYEMLTLRGAAERQEFLLEHLEQVRPDITDARRIRERAALNGHFKDLKPPEF